MDAAGIRRLYGKKHRRADCRACGKEYDAVSSDWIIRLDAPRRQLVWRCPQCRHINHTDVSFLHDLYLDWRPGRRA
jgi:uncharacterized protein with PIN domain